MHITGSQKERGLSPEFWLDNFGPQAIFDEKYGPLLMLSFKHTTPTCISWQLNYPYFAYQITQGLCNSSSPLKYI